MWIAEKNQNCFSSSQGDKQDTGENIVINMTTFISGFVGWEKRFAAMLILYLWLVTFPKNLGFYVQVSMPSTGGNMPELLMIRITFSSAIHLITFNHYLKWRPVLKEMADTEVVSVYCIL